MVKVFLKGLQKNWLGSFLAALSVAIFIPVIAGIWPTFQDQIATIQELMQNPVYKVFLGEFGISDLTTWFGFYSMYIFTWLEMLMLFLTIFIPARIVTTEVEKRTLDVMLSYPVQRWRFLLEKFSVYLVYNLFYPILILIFTVVSTYSLGEQMDYTIFTYVLIGFWLQFFALGAISLLCSTIFLESKKTIAAAGAINIGQWILMRIGGIIESLEVLKNFSIFNYMNATSIMNAGNFPIGDFFILLGISIAAFVTSLIIFEKRELL